MSRLALRLLRHRPGSTTATLIALTFGVMLLMAMGSLVDAGLRHQPAPQRYAAADVVIARTELTVTSTDAGERTTTSVRLPEPGPVPAALADQVRAVPGVTAVTPVPAARPGQVEALLITVAPGADRAALDRLAGSAGARTFAGADRGRAESSAETAAQDLLVQIGAFFGGYVFLLVVFVVAGLVGLSVRHRRRDLALLRAIAATPGQVRRMLVAEAALLGGVASVLGLPAGVLATAWVRGELVERHFVPDSIPIGASPFAAAIAVVVIALAAMLSAVIAARRATAIRPTEALGEAAVEPPRTGWVRAVLGLAVLAGTVAVGSVAVGTRGLRALSSAIGMLFLCVAAVALLAPWINRIAAWLLTPVLRRVAGVSGHLAAANLRANARGMATVLTALVLSVGFGGSVWFLQGNLQRQTVAQLRDGMLAQHALTAPGGIAAEAVAQIRHRPGVSAVTGVRQTSVLIKNADAAEETAARAIDPAGAGTMDLGVVAGDLAGLGPVSMAVSTMQASTNHWTVGDQVPLWLGDGTPVTLRVAAIYTRALGFGDIVLDERTLPPGPYEQVLIRTLPGADLSTVAAGQPGGTLVPTSELTDRIATDMDTGAWLNELLVGVMVGYAALAAANAMVLAALARGRELAALRLAGTTRRQIGRMVNAEQAGLLGVSVAVGAAIAAATLITTVHALTGTLVPYVPPLGWITVLGGATLLAMTTTILPVRHLLRTPTIEALGTRE